MLAVTVIDASVMVGVFYSKDEFHAISKEWFERHLGLGGADAYYVALAVREGLPLVTWDRQQRERSAQHIVARSPEMLLNNHVSGK